MFHKNSRMRDGLSAECKLCMRQRNRDHYLRNVDKRRKQAEAWHAANPGKNAEYSANWRDKNPGAQSRCDASWYSRNRDRKLAQDKARREANIDEFLRRERNSYARHASNRKSRRAEWADRNSHKIRFYAAERRALLKQRMPQWLSQEQQQAILGFYELAKLIESVSGVAHHVDHIVPLKGRLVSGLHVPWNLQCLPASDNLRKSNLYDPESS
jgi:hypothetical protein